MSDKSRPYTFDRVVRMVLTAAAFTALILLLRYLSDVLLPFAAAVVLAYLLNPIVSYVERRTGSRGFAVGFTLGTLSLIGLILLCLLIPLMVDQVARFRDNVTRLSGEFTASLNVKQEARPAPLPEPPKNGNAESGEPSGPQPEKSTLGWTEFREGLKEYRETAGELSRVDRLKTLLHRVKGTLIGQGFERLGSFLNSDEFNKFAIDVTKRLAAGGWSIVTFAVSTVLGLAGLIIVLLYLVFLLLDYREYARTWHTFLPPDYRASILEFIEQFDIAMRRYFRGQSVVALLVGVLMSIGFMIIGLPMAVPLGIFVGLLNMVPYLQTVAIVPGVLLAIMRALDGDSSIVWSVVLLLLVFGIVQLIQDAILTPRILGNATGLRPVAVMLGLFIWGKLLGFLGLLLAIPLTCLGIAYYRRFVLLQSADATKLTDEVAAQPDGKG